ncbi:MAG: hypothetical protein JXL67_13065, partial [Calditrichaeota bacterium]|nr:hypothetical protein [Calditrichota bacterium]
DCNIVNPRDKGISGGENSHLKLRNIIIEKANIGIASKDQSVIEGSKIELNNCNYGIVAFRKKPEFGGAKVNLQQVKESGVSKTFLIENGSELIIDNKIYKGTAKNVAGLFYVQ